MRPAPSTRTARRLVAGRAAAVTLVLLVAAGFALRWSEARVETLVGSDACQYLLLARGIAEGRGYASGGSEHPDLSRLPVYPLLIAGASPLFPDFERAARFVTTLSAALMAIPLWYLGRRLFGPDAAVAGGALGAFSCLHGYAGFLLPDPTSLLLVLFATASAVGAARRPSVLRWARTGVIAGAAALCRPEAVLLAPLLAIAAMGPVVRRPSAPSGIARASAVVAAALVVYAPYAIWSSAKLGRFVPAPGIEYVRDARALADRIDLDSVGDPTIDWNEKARYMLDRDGTTFLLQAYFLEGRIPQTSAGPDEPVPVDDGRSVWRRRADELGRRWYIVRSSLRALPGSLRTEHLAPVVPWALALLGLGVGLFRRGTRRSLPILVAAGIVALAPYYSHVEPRFGYPVFAGMLVFASWGWGGIAGLLSGRARAARVVVHLVIAAGALVPALFHDPRAGAPTLRREAQREIAREADARLPEGPLLAVRPLVPYFAGRPYRALPIATPEEVLAYARHEGAAGIVLEGRVDRRERPELADWFDGRLPEGLREVAQVAAGDGGVFRALELVPEGS